MGLGLVFVGGESGRIWDFDTCQVKSVSGLVLTESGLGRVWNFLSENWVRLTSELSRADRTVFN